tara:strand:+ start:2624 stop:2923 length:300 start_codon:yes stop_codon:yes gene_type:complete
MENTIQEELLSQEEKMLQIRETTDSIAIMSNNTYGVTIFVNPCNRITDKAMSVCLPFKDKMLWIPKSLILLMDRKPNWRGGLTYEIVLPKWFLKQNYIS